MVNFNWRKLMYLAAAALAMLNAYDVWHGDRVTEIVVEAVPHTAKLVRSAEKKFSLEVDPSVPSVEEMPDPAKVESTLDPFGTRNWGTSMVPASPVVQQMPVLVQVANSSATRVTATPPYTYVGRMQDGARKVIYLAHGDMALIAEAGAILENSYKVETVDDQRVELKNLQTGEIQYVTLPAAD